MPMKEVAITKANGDETVVGLNEYNLRKLANGLLTLDNDTKNFDMFDFVNPGEKLDESFPMIPINNIPTAKLNKSLKNECNTCACAVGWAPVFGVRRKPGEDFSDFSFRTLILTPNEDDTVWRWCFDSDWTFIDNTPRGAAVRILHLLEKKTIPDYLTPVAGPKEIKRYRDWKRRAIKRLGIEEEYYK